MARQHFGINDGFTGAVGTVIGYQWRGKWCMRARPRYVRNPDTHRQRMARALFGQVSHLASQMREALRVGLRHAALDTHRTECNHFMSVNSGCFALSAGELVVDYEDRCLSEGPVAPVGFQVPVRDGASVTVAFEKNPEHLRAEQDDKVYLYAWCPARGVGQLSAPTYRRNRQVTIELPEDWAGLEVHLYGLVQDYAGRASMSVYIGCGVSGVSDERDESDLSDEPDSLGNSDKEKESVFNRKSEDCPPQFQSSVTSGRRRA